MRYKDIKDTPKDCVFCKKIQEENLHHLGGDTVWFEPLNPVTKGHILVVPIHHVEDFSEDWAESAETMHWASILAEKMKNVNLITSKGEYATQSIKHFHIHLVPRRKSDNLKLPWSL